MKGTITWIKVEDDNFPSIPDEYLCMSEEGELSVERVTMTDINTKSVYCDSTDSGYATHWAYINYPDK